MKKIRFYVINTFTLKPPSYKKCSTCQRPAFWRHDCHHYLTRQEVSRYACSDHQDKKFYLIEEDVFRYLVDSQKSI